MKINLSRYISAASTELAMTLDLPLSTARLEVILLMQFVLQVNHAWLIAHADDEIPMETDEAFQVLFKRRLNGEPMAYILGEREFFGITLKVTPDTLIPRPDTEILVETALEKIAYIRQAQDERHLDNSRRNDSVESEKPLSVLDLGTGSGAIALAIAQHAPNTNITAVDISERTLKVAEENAKNLNIHNVRFVLSDWFSALQNETFDLIISNPPYIENNDVHLSQGDLRFEPRAALASGDDGLDDIRQIIEHAASYLKPQGLLMFEHGYNQAESVSNLLASAHFTTIQTYQDLGGNDRVTLGRMI